VISSTTNLDDGIFKDAVQGLVKICFPLGIMEQLGTDMIRQHMAEEDAPAENVARMTELFRPELVHRMAGMLAGYLDTSAKVKACIQSISTATSRLHAEVMDDDLEDIATNRTTVPSYAMNRDSDTELLLTQTNQEYKGYDSYEELVDVEEPQSVPRRQAPRITRKVSTTWRWDFDPDTVNEEDILNVIKRPADLFAFHALPIAKDLVAPNAGRKEIRNTIQAMLNETDNFTFSKWIESFHKLQNGDDTMLVRVPSEKAPDGRSAMTPAPTGARRQANPDAGHDPSRNEVVQDAAPRDHGVKIDGNTRPKVSGRGARREPAETDHDTMTNSATIQRTSDEQAQNEATRQAHVLGHIAQMTLDAPDNGENPEASTMHPRTPIIDVLWGVKDFKEGRWAAVHAILSKRRQRMSMHVSMTCKPFDRS
jgi:hypothetical protein